jgi:hypothetical protein
MIRGSNGDKNAAVGRTSNVMLTACKASGLSKSRIVDRLKTMAEVKVGMGSDERVRVVRSDSVMVSTAEIGYGKDGTLVVGVQTISARECRLPLAKSLATLLVWMFLVTMLLCFPGVRNSMALEWSRRHALGGDVGLVAALKSSGIQQTAAGFANEEPSSLLDILIDDPVIFSSAICLIGLMGGLSVGVVRHSPALVWLIGCTVFGVPTSKALDATACEFRDEIVSLFSN